MNKREYRYTLHYVILLLLFVNKVTVVVAQADTITPLNGKLNTRLLKSGASAYAVYWEDSASNMTGNIEMWKRELQVQEGRYQFNWSWYRKDSLYARILTAGSSATMQPLFHSADYFRQGKFMIQFKDNIVTIPDSLQKTDQHRLFKVLLNPPAFAFPMDLEIFPLLPFKKGVQKFVIAFYEPGSEKSAWYHATNVGKQKLPIHGKRYLQCRLLRLDYASDSYAYFWIDEKSNVVVKMKEYYQGKYRYKVKLY